MLTASLLLATVALAIPPVPDKSPVSSADSLRHFQLPDDLAIELAAAEPEVVDPIDVRFDEFMADDMATVARIYELAGQPLGPGSRQAMERYVVEHPRGRHGGVIYDADQLGLDLEEQRAALKFYVERFGVTRE